MLFTQNITWHSRNLLASQMARMGVPNAADEMINRTQQADAFVPEPFHAHHTTPRMKSMYISPEMPGRHHSAGANSTPSAVHHHHANPSPQADDGDKYLLAAKVNNIFGMWWRLL